MQKFASVDIFIKCNTITIALGRTTLSLISLCQKEIT